MPNDQRQEPEVLKAKLRGDTAEAVTAIEARISLGYKLLEIPITNQATLSKVQTDRHDWHDGNRSTVESLFPNDEIANRLDSGLIGNLDFSGAGIASEKRDLDELIRHKIRELESIRDQLSPNKDSA